MGRLYYQQDQELSSQWLAKHLLRSELHASIGSCKTKKTFIEVQVLTNHFISFPQCLTETWIFCVELQLAIVFTVVIGLMTSLKKRGSEALGWLLLIGVVVLGFVMNALSVYLRDLPPTWLWTLPDPE